jgi:hypothetical protein
MTFMQFIQAVVARIDKDGFDGLTLTHLNGKRVVHKYKHGESPERAARWCIGVANRLHFDNVVVTEKPAAQLWFHTVFVHNPANTDFDTELHMAHHGNLWHRTEGEEGVARDRLIPIRQFESTGHPVDWMNTYQGEYAKNMQVTLHGTSFRTHYTTETMDGARTYYVTIEDASGPLPPEYNRDWVQREAVADVVSRTGGMPSSPLFYEHTTPADNLQQLVGLILMGLPGIVLRSVYWMTTPSGARRSACGSPEFDAMYPEVVSRIDEIEGRGDEYF